MKGGGEVEPERKSYTALDSADYGYNAGNQRITFTNAAGTCVQYTNDPIGQLKIANSSENTEDRGYTYDTAWNLNYRTNNGALSTFKVDPKNQLTNAPGTGTQTYDGNGNLVQGHASGPDRLYTYDDENRLLAVEREEVWRTEFTYDGMGRLRVRQEFDFTDDWELAGETHYIYDGMRVIQERDASNVPTVSYTRGTDLSGSLEGAGGIGGLLGRSHGYSGGNWSTHNFYHADGNGNITYLVNSSQTLAASYPYDPFGNTMSSSGALAADNAYRFSSKEVHGNSGMYYYGYRFYDANVQRWLNRDLMEERGGFNLYGFVRNNPCSDFDPSGLESYLDCSARCGRQNLRDLLGCAALGVGGGIIGGAICWLNPPLCVGAARVYVGLMAACIASAEAREVACVAACAITGHCPRPPIGPYP